MPLMEVPPHRETFTNIEQRLVSGGHVERVLWQVLAS